MNTLYSARWFSLFNGLLSTGVAIGPTLGTILIKSTGTILSVFYLYAAGFVIFIATIILIVPESLSVEARRDIADRLARENEEAQAMYQEERSNSPFGFFWQIVSRAMVFFAPLAIFLPRQRVSTKPSEKASGMDWNLTYVAIAFGVYTLVQAVSTIASNLLLCMLTIPPYFA